MLFVIVNGVSATYAINGKKIIGNVNNNKFTFTIWIISIRIIIDVNELLCSSSNLDSDSHGYFAENTIFTTN